MTYEAWEGGGASVPVPDEPSWKNTSWARGTGRNVLSTTVFVSVDIYAVFCRHGCSTMVNKSMFAATINMCHLVLGSGVLGCSFYESIYFCTKVLHQEKSIQLLMNFLSGCAENGRSTRTGGKVALTRWI